MTGKKSESGSEKGAEKKAPASARKKSGTGKNGGSGSAGKSGAGRKRKPAAKKSGAKTSASRKKPNLSNDRTAKNLAAMERAMERAKKKRAKQIAGLKTSAALLAVFLGVSVVLLLVKVNFFSAPDGGRTARSESGVPAPSASASETENPAGTSLLENEAPAQRQTQRQREMGRTAAEQTPVQAKKAETPQVPQTETAQTVTQAAQETEAVPAAQGQIAMGKPEEQKEEPAADSLLIPKGSGTLCFVFDDAGHNLAQLEPFLRLPFSCTIAVLPGLPHSAECAAKIRDAGKELFLHQPMQALNPDMNPGPGAILPGMGQDEIRAVIGRNIAEVGPVAGLNNHEGSMITADKTAMEAVFDAVEAEQILFLDSRTNAETKAPEIARERNMKIWERAVFLDNTPQRADMEQAVLHGIRIAAQKGHAILIGHIWSDNLAPLLAELHPKITAAGYTLRDISQLQAEFETGGRHTE